ncbi:MAG: hypothetical protein Kow0069_13650 [Promethearchaeota archaeon]
MNGVDNASKPPTNAGAPTSNDGERPPVTTNAAPAAPTSIPATFVAGNLSPSFKLPKMAMRMGDSRQTNRAGTSTAVYCAGKKRPTPNALAASRSKRSRVGGPWSREPSSS